ncbi:hypothetical protein [Aeromonas salmonicida]|uniref:hypothetical protein n=1 Tax=Aeromonas salmonicida TaxID=645 RepID=UPI003D1E0D55
MIRYGLFPFWLLFGNLLLTQPLLAVEIFTHASPESEQDKRASYYRDLLQLTLDKTRDSYGEYELQAAPPMNRVRLRLAIQQGSYPNFFAVDSQRPASEAESLDYVPFPVDLGILSYRICFVSPQRQQALARLTRLDELKSLLHGQGRGWQDVTILRHAGMRVQEVDNYERLFKLVERGRIDLFCRGANELLTELETHRDLTRLTVDQHIALHYPFIHLFYTHKGNKHALKRIQTGLLLAWQDGSLQTLWLKTFKPALDFARLDKRRLFRLDNPQLRELEIDYRDYTYDPLRGTFGSGGTRNGEP